MPRLDYRRCKQCGRPAAEAGPLSHVRLCRDCAQARFGANLLDLTTHSGYYFEHWRYQVAASVGFVPLDVLPPQP